MSRLSMRFTAVLPLRVVPSKPFEGVAQVGDQRFPVGKLDQAPAIVAVAALGHSP